MLAAFEAGETDILVGTQMIAKGHDFPRVTLVGVIDADVGLGLPDFRAAERTFQLLTQVAGRAGPRATWPGEVILQSHLPDHYALRLACAQDYEAFFEHEMEFRRTMGYPPAGGAGQPGPPLARRAARPAQDARGAGRRGCGTLAAGRYRVLGPRAGAAGAAAAGAPVPGPAEGRPRVDARGGAARRWSSATARCAGRAWRWTWTRSA